MERLSFLLTIVAYIVDISIFGSFASEFEKRIEKTLFLWIFLLLSYKKREGIIMVS